MAEANFIVEIDTDNDGTFATDVSGDLMSCWWEMGFTDTLRPLPNPARGQLVLDNRGHGYSPDHVDALSGLTKGRAVRIQIDDGYSPITMAMMRLGEIKPDAGQYERRRTTIPLEGWLERARQQDRLSVAVQTEKTMDELAETLVDAAGIYPPAYDGTPSSWMDFETGQTLFPYAFDDLADSDTIYSQIQRIIESEGFPARGLISRAGKLRLFDRHYLVTKDVSVATFANTMFDLDYSFGAMIANRVTVAYHPRSLDTDGIFTLHTTAEAIKVRSGDTVVVNLGYDDGSGNPVSTTDPIDPTGADWQANRRENGSGDDISANFTVTASHYSTHSEWEIVNSGSRDGFILAGATQRANNKITDYGRQTITREDATSQADFGIYPLTVQASLLPSQEEAVGLADYLLQQLKDPRGRTRRIRLKPNSSDALLAQALALSCENLDRITVQETQTGEDADYFIIGERHELTERRDYILDWFMEPAGGMDDWLIFGTGERSLMDGTNLLGY